MATVEMFRCCKRRAAWQLLTGAVVLAQGLQLGSAFADEPTLPQPVAITNVAQLRALSLGQTMTRIPVNLRAQVTAVTPSPRTIFLQDQTGGTFITAVRTDAPKVKPGDLVQVNGVTHTGLFVPGITAARFRVVGHETLPVPPPVSFDDLLSGRHHYQRVEISGIVRSVELSQTPPLLKLAVGTRKLDVKLTAEATNLPPLLDARVRIIGLAAGYINARRQLIAPQMVVSRLEDIQVEIPPLADPFQAPLVASDELLNFRPDGLFNHRIRVRGIVTHQQPGGAIFLRDGDYGLLVQTTQEGQVRPGDIVEAVGSAVMGRFSAFLEDAEFRVTGSGPPPAPLLTTITEALHGTNDANLVSVTAQLIEVLQTPAQTILVLEAEDTDFRARVPRTSLSLENGSRLQLTGVCRVEEFNLWGNSFFRANPRTVELLLRSPADIQVLSAPSVWTTTRFMLTAGISLVAALVAFVWIGMLRRRLAEQSRVIREQVQREAALEERHRMAREMHDTMAQSFSGLGFQLDALAARMPTESEPFRRQLETARQMVRYGQESFRRSLLNLRAQELESTDLTAALPEIARQMVAGTGIELRCQVTRPNRPLPEAVETNLLRIGQECLTNAVHHARPKRIDLSLANEAGGVCLVVSDDGVGFDPEPLRNGTNGHFGLRGIYERAEQIRARVKLDSRSGQGTTVTVTVPID